MCDDFYAKTCAVSISPHDGEGEEKKSQSLDIPFCRESWCVGCVGEKEAGEAGMCFKHKFKIPWKCFPGDSGEGGKNLKELGMMRWCFWRILIRFLVDLVGFLKVLIRFL